MWIRFMSRIIEKNRDKKTGDFVPVCRRFVGLGKGGYIK
jgi:hypothetical protein